MWSRRPVRLPHRTGNARHANQLSSHKEHFPQLFHLPPACRLANYMRVVSPSTGGSPRISGDRPACRPRSGATSGRLGCRAEPSGSCPQMAIPWLGAGARRAFGSHDRHADTARWAREPASRSARERADGQPDRPPGARQGAQAHPVRRLCPARRVGPADRPGPAPPAGSGRACAGTQQHRPHPCLLLDRAWHPLVGLLAGRGPHDTDR